MPATDDNETHEEAYLGMWHVFDRDGVYQGRLVVHRTRSTPDDLPDYLPGEVSAPYAVEDQRLKELTRIGTFYKYQDAAYVDALRVTGQLNAGGYLRLYIGEQVGPGGDPLGTEYTKGDFWGTMVLKSADNARDGLNQTYVRDFYYRAMHNWLGSWDITKADGGKISIFLREIDRIPSPDGKYQMRGSLNDEEGMSIVGTVDGRGLHAVLDIPNGPKAAGTCVLDMTFARAIKNGAIDDKIISGSTIQCPGSSPVGITGTRKSLPPIV
jgi:hypothetical protein